MKKLQNQEIVFATKNAKHTKWPMEVSTDKKIVSNDDYGTVPDV